MKLFNNFTLSPSKSERGGTKQVKRDSNFELFRIITMLLIIAGHYLNNSGLLAENGPIYSNPLSYRSIYLLIFGAWAKMGINCFVLISGYFMCQSNISAKKFAKLLFEIMFYRIVINTIFWISGYAVISIKELLKVLIPIIRIEDGFTSAYLIFFLFIPFLNILIHNMNEKQHIYLIALCMFTYVFLGTLPFFSVTMNYVSWFIVLYFLASYIRIYPKKIFINAFFWKIMTFISAMLSAASVIVCAWLGTKLNRRMAYYFVTDSNTFLAVLTALCAFMCFKNLKMRYSKTINTIAASTFGVLLIHANSDTMRKWLWRDIFKNVEMYESRWCYLYPILVVVFVFIVCFVIDYLRIRFIETPFFKFWDYLHWKKNTKVMNNR